MTKFNLSQIMKDAWNFYRKGKMTFSACLRKAWRIAKGVGLQVQTWFLVKNFDRNQRYVMECSDHGGETVLLRTTEKAVLLRWTCDDASFSSWIPKACLY